MQRATTDRRIQYSVSRTSERFASIPPITLVIDMADDGSCPFRFQGYFTPEEAFQVAAALTTVAMEVERTDGVEQDLPF
jgi:hypothetical protein